MGRFSDRNLARLGRFKPENGPLELLTQAVLSF
jgi:hypothetical protein